MVVVHPVLIVVDAEVVEVEVLEGVELYILDFFQMEEVAKFLILTQVVHSQQYLLLIGVFVEFDSKNIKILNF
jgi:hypothetical protein